ncbi:MAG: hypothetical protein RSA79_03595 [Oscillospiraceae bacterium]
MNNVFNEPTEPLEPLEGGKNFWSIQTNEKANFNVFPSLSRIGLGFLFITSVFFLIAWIMSIIT